MGRVCPPVIRSMRILAVIWPISSIGTWMVVSMGDRYWAVSMSSMLMTEMSLGIFRPLSRTARMAPMAVTSLLQKNAVTRGCCSKIFRAPFKPPPEVCCTEAT